MKKIQVKMEYTKVNLCRLGQLSCFGCCGHNFGDKKELEIAIWKNTKELESSLSLKEFMKSNNSLRECGVCKSVVKLKDGTFGCPGHPMQCGEELRECNILFECKKSFLYNNEWKSEARKRFLETIKDMDSIEYSLFMSDDAKTFL